MVDIPLLLVSVMSYVGILTLRRIVHLRTDRRTENSMALVRKRRFRFQVKHTRAERCFLMHHRGFEPAGFHSVNYDGPSWDKRAK
jgi:hypothetical protein